MNEGSVTFEKTTATVGRKTTKKQNCKNTCSLSAQLANQGVNWVWMSACQFCNGTEKKGAGAGAFRSYSIIWQAVLMNCTYLYSHPDKMEAPVYGNMWVHSAAFHREFILIMYSWGRKSLTANTTTLKKSERITDSTAEWVSVSCLRTLRCFTEAWIHRCHL